MGAGLIYFILRLGKLLFGRQKLALPADSKIIFTETAVQLPDIVTPQRHARELFDLLNAKHPLASDPPGVESDADSPP